VKAILCRRYGKQVCGFSGICLVKMLAIVTGSGRISINVMRSTADLIEKPSGVVFSVLL
jgi:hypothetical protein